MKKLITLLFTFSILYSPYSYSNILYDLIGKMSPSDVAFYDKSYETSTYKVFETSFINFKAIIEGNFAKSYNYF